LTVVCHGLELTRWGRRKPDVSQSRDLHWTSAG